MAKNALASIACGFLLFTVIPVMGQPGQGQMPDGTRQMGKTGTDLVLSVIDQIAQSGIFPSEITDINFLSRASFSASRDGADGPGAGGIWRLTEVQFQATQNTAIPIISDKIASIQQKFGIDWSQVNYADLGMPLYSGLAMSLYFCTVAIPADIATIAGQARFWLQTVANGRTEQTFLDAANNLPDRKSRDPNCPRNQKGVSLSLLQYAIVSWTGPRNINPERSSFRGASDVQIAPGSSYLFTNEYTDSNGNVKTCVFTASASGGSAPPMEYCPDNLVMYVPDDESSIKISWSPPRANNMSPTRKTRNPDETSTFNLGPNLVEYFFEARDANDNLIGEDVCAFIVNVVRGAGRDTPPAVEGDLIGDGVCGTRPVFTQPRIVNGNAAPAGSWPWIGSLQDDFGSHLCGATLIRPRWAVTAAHCIVDPAIENGRVPTKIVFGDILLTMTTVNRQESTFRQVFNHPSYNPTDPIARNDITLLYLNTAMEVTDFVRPICLATRNEGPTYQNCKSAGWGDLQQGGPSPELLQEVSLPLIAPPECQPSSNIICAGGAPQNTGDTCQGDSGGPLICESTNSQDNSLHLVGIVSTGEGCGVPNSPGFYTRITSFLDWIRGTIISQGISLPN